MAFFNFARSSIRIQLREMKVLAIVTCLWTLSVHFCYTQDYAEADSIATMQTAVTANSITDGQPGPPKLPFFQSNSTYSADSGFSHNLCVANTFAEHGFWRNSLFSLNVLSFTAIDNNIDYDKTFNGSWQHRWRYEKNNKPTIATNVTLIVPFDEPDALTEAQTTFIVAKNLNTKSVGFFHLTISTPFEDFSENINYSILLGHKLFLNDSNNLFLDVVYQENAITFETALEFKFSNSMVLSPGINYTWDTELKEGIFGFGAVVLFQTQ